MGCQNEQKSSCSTIKVVHRIDLPASRAIVTNPRCLWLDNSVHVLIRYVCDWLMLNAAKKQQKLKFD